jgi:hypothetical protein
MGEEARPESQRQPLAGGDLEHVPSGRLQLSEAHDQHLQHRCQEQDPELGVDDEGRKDRLDGMWKRVGAEHAVHRHLERDRPEQHERDRGQLHREQPEQPPPKRPDLA